MNGCFQPQDGTRKGAKMLIEEEQPAKVRVSLPGVDLKCASALLSFLQLCSPVAN